MQWGKREIRRINGADTEWVDVSSIPLSKCGYTKKTV